MEQVDNNPIESSWFERFYSHFIYRDFCYLFAGGLFICTIIYALKGEIFPPNEFLPRELSIELIGFLIGSYFLGLAIQSLGIRFKIFPKTYYSPTPYSDSLIFFQDIITFYHPKVINEHERTFFMALIGRTVGFSSFFGAILMIAFALFYRVFMQKVPSIEYIVLTIFLVSYGIIMIYDSNNRHKQYHKQKEALAEDIISKQK